jgi:hypothetical protein
MPLHQYQGSPNGGTPCVYRVGSTECGTSKGSSVHGVVDTAVKDFVAAFPDDPPTAPQPKSQLNYTAEEDMMVHVYQPSPELLVYVDKCTYLGVDGKRCYRSKGSTWHRTAQARQPEHYDTYAGRITLDSPPSTMQGLMVFFDGCVELAGRKDAAYGGAWRRQGYMGNLARLMSKSDRLRNMLWNNRASYGEDQSETVQDTLQDMANIVGFMYRNYEEGNQWGSNQ